MKRKLYQVIASTLQARTNCQNSGNVEWFENHTEKLLELAKNNLPSGSGIDSGCKIDIEASNPNKIVITFGYHHMNEGGMYDGWTDHKAIITPSLLHDFDIRITGRDRNQVKEYLLQEFDYALGLEVE